VRILTVSAFYENHGGGIEIVAGAMARALGRRGHDCRWAAAGFDPAPQDPMLQPVPLSASDPLERWTGLPMPVPGSSARRLLEREVAAADAVIVHDALYVSSLLAARYAARHGKPWLLIQHIGAIPYTNPLLRLAMATANRLVTHPLLARAPQAVFISDAVRQFFAGTQWKRPPVLLLNGVDHDRFRPAKGRERARLRTRFGMTGQRRQFLFIGRFVEKKGLATIRAMAAARPEWNFHLVGGGPIDPGGWGLPNVHPLGRRNRDELAELYRAADALLLPSVGEGFPLVVQEAMASGLPVFCGPDSAYADPAARELLHAVEVDPSDPGGTAQRFAAAIADSTPGPDPKLAVHARTAYNWDSNARWLEEQLGELKGELPVRCRQPMSSTRLSRQCSDMNATRSTGAGT
jgi:glycosyltransferase involved in cell wall biosynthesis